MLSPRRALLDYGRLEFERPNEVKKVLENASFESDESLVLYFGTCTKEGVKVNQAELLPDSCYDERTPSRMKFNYEACYRTFAKLDLEFYRKGLKLVGTGHIHKTMKIASLEDRVAATYSPLFK